MTVRVVVAGGGYAGLAALSTLRDLIPSAHLTLVDPSTMHLKLTQLHEAASRPLAELQVPFADLAARLAFEHVRGWAGTACAGLTCDVLRTAAQCGRLPVVRADGAHGALAPAAASAAAAGAEPGAAREPGAGATGAGAAARGADAGPEIPFDYLVLACGGQPLVAPSAAAASARPRRVFSIAELRDIELRQLLRDRVEAARRARSEEAFRVTVVGAGATGVQYAFELSEALRRLGAPGAVRLADQRQMPLTDMPWQVQRHVVERLRAADIEWLPRARFVAQVEDRVQLDGGDDEAASVRMLPSALTLLVAGVAPHPFDVRTNRFGQVQLDGSTLERVFAAGDGAHYDSSGSNAASSQVALRQGKHVAVNVSRVYRRRDPLPYVFGELGYVVSLGVADAAGWVLSRSNTVTGLPAVAVKNVVDSQYDLFLQGIDTYVI